MKVLVLGGSGMLGHKATAELAGHFPTAVTSRAPLPAAVTGRAHNVAGVDATSFEAVREVLEEQRPEAVLNCIGIIKQAAAATMPIPSIEINSLFPHRVAEVCRAIGARLIHISTDCVFSGLKGMYREEDFPDAGDLYGRTKLLGEVGGEGVLTLRTSIIGRELAGASGLIEWFLSKRGGEVAGYSEAIFSGLTTAELSRVIVRVIKQHPDLAGVYHVSAEPISKLRLLELANAAFGANVRISPSPELRIDRSLDSSRFRAATGWLPPTWEAMIREMAADPTPYDEWRAPLES
jgi:dTDP-4-dehydrorhamnose reductase